MTNFWDIIVQSNTFNFAILILLLTIIFSKINIMQIFENIKKEIADLIENAQNEKLNAEKELSIAEKTLSSVEIEVKEKLDNAKLNVQNISKQIIKNTEEQIQRIEGNIEHVILAEEKNLSAKLTNNTVFDSLHLAKKHILNELKENKELHEKFIDDSIEEIDKVNI